MTEGLIIKSSINLQSNGVQWFKVKLNLTLRRNAIITWILRCFVNTSTCPITKPCSKKKNAYQTRDKQNREQNEYWPEHSHPHPVYNTI